MQVELPASGAVSQMSPADCWIGALWTEGVALFVLGLMCNLSIPELALFPLVTAAAGFCALALFFAAAVPRESSAGTFLTPLALRLLRVVPSPNLAARLGAIAACVAPCLLTDLGDVGGASSWVFALAGTLGLGTLIAGRGAARDAGLWDTAAPCLMIALTVAYALSVWALPPADPDYGTLGLVVAAAAQLFLLRHAAARHWADLATLVQKERGVPDVTIPLESSSAETERTTPAALAPAPAPGDAPALVESGTFRIDASKMIEKLRERQLAEAGDFILAWLRCAVASGASRIDLEQDWDALVMNFDGKPFTQQQLSDPYRALLDPEAEDRERGSQFAYGLLAILRFKPQAIWVYSGEGRERALTRLAARGATDLPTPKDPGRGTFIAASLGLPGLWRAYRANRKAWKSFGLASAALTVQGRPWQDPMQASDGWKFEDREGWRFAWKIRTGEPASRIRVYHLGALVQEIEEPLEGDAWQIDAAVAHPDLRLSLSQAGVVRDGRFDRGLTLLKGIRDEAIQLDQMER